MVGLLSLRLAFSQHHHPSIQQWDHHLFATPIVPVHPENSHHLFTGIHLYNRINSSHSSIVSNPFILSIPSHHLFFLLHSLTPCISIGCICCDRYLVALLDVGTGRFSVEFFLHQFSIIFHLRIISLEIRVVPQFESVLLTLLVTSLINIFSINSIGHHKTQILITVTPSSTMGC